jgi:hypothetical protein
MAIVFPQNFHVPKHFNETGVALYAMRIPIVVGSGSENPGIRLHFTHHE